MNKVLSGSFALLIVIVTLVFVGYMRNKDGIKKRKVYYDMDGNCDDFVAFLLLLNLKNVDLVGVAITPADCEVKPAKEFVSKLIYKKGLKAPIVASDAKPVNDFPQEWKSYTLKTTLLPRLLKIDYSKENELEIEASEHMYSTAQKIYEESGEKTTFLITGPPSNLVRAMEKYSDMKDYIEEVFWMGGAIDVPGNVIGVPDSEYNAYWDPPSTKKFLESGLQIKVLSLDSTNSIPVDKNMLTRLAKYSNYDGINLTNELFAIAYWVDDKGESNYYAWDCLAVMALGFDDLITYKEVEVDVVTENNEKEGKIYKKEGSNHVIKYGQALDSKAVENFYDSFIKTLKYNF